MSKYLLDTNIISYLADPNSPHRKNIKQHFLSLTDEDHVSVSIITLYELSYGLYSLEDTTESAILKEGIYFVEEYLEVLPLDVSEIDVFGRLKAKYKDATGIHNRANKKNDLDFLIAATAVTHDAILVSNDAIFDKLFAIERSIRHDNWIK